MSLNNNKKRYEPAQKRRFIPFFAAYSKIKKPHYAEPHNEGCRVIAATHKESKLPLLKAADEAVLDNETLAGTFKGVTKALELVGPKTLRDTLRCVKRGGIVCNTGILGGVYTLDGFDPIKEIPNGVYLTGFFSNYPALQTMSEIFDFIDSRRIKPDVGAVYSFENISAVLFDMDAHKVDGKIVVNL